MVTVDGRKLREVLRCNRDPRITKEQREKMREEMDEKNEAEYRNLLRTFARY